MGKRKRITRKECQKLVNKFEMEGLMAQKRLVEHGKGENHEGKRRIAL